jgi:type 1 fimbrial protein
MHYLLKDTSYETYQNNGSQFILSLVSVSAIAAEMNAGTIHFTGQIIEPSCTIDGDNGTDSTVPLGTYPNSLFTRWVKKVN